jgi:hypothetical protein
MGIFLFVFGGSIAGMAFGAPDVMRLGLKPNPVAAADPAWLKAANIALKGLALIIFSVAVWLLITDGAVFIEFLRRHH